jgi:hypothetical protein
MVISAGGSDGLFAVAVFVTRHLPCCARSSLTLPEGDTKLKAPYIADRQLRFCADYIQLGVKVRPKPSRVKL